MIQNSFFEEKMLYKKCSIKHRSDGRYSCDVRIAFDDVSKKYIYKTIYGVDKNDVMMKRADFIHEKIKEQNGETETQELMQTEMEKWLYKTKFGSIKDNSFDRLEGIYLHQIRPNISELPHKKIKDIKSEDLKQLLEINLYRGYSYSTILKVYRFLSEFFKYQVQTEIISKNPMLSVQMYKKDFVLSTQERVREERDTAREKLNNGEDVSDKEFELACSTLRMEDKTEMRILTDEEIERLKNAANKRYANGKLVLKQAKYFIFILNTGIREGEAEGLCYSDIDFENKTLTVEHNIVITKKRDKTGRLVGGSKLSVSSPKSKKSKSTIPINDTAIKIIRELQSEEPAGYNGYIVHNNGRYINKRAFKKRFYNLLRQANIAPCGLHTLRHTFASKLYEATQGDNKLVSELIRHSSAAFTQETYIHLQEKYKNKVVRAFEI